MRSENAGFWRRLGAFVLVDLPIQVVVGLAVGTGLGIAGGLLIGLLSLPEAAALRVVENAAGVCGLVFVWLYSAGLESSAFQATVGKLVFGMSVTDIEGRRIGFGRASIRHFGKILSGLFLGVGFLMIALSEKRQALHDGLAGTLVRRRSQSAPDNNALQLTKPAQATELRS